MSLLSGSRLLPDKGNVQSYTVFVLRFPEKKNLYWSVQAIDNGICNRVRSLQKIRFSIDFSQSSQIYADSLMPNTLKLHWTRGMASLCCVCTAGIQRAAIPVNGVTYLADSQFSFQN